jgi:hypothetical protein
VRLLELLLGEHFHIGIREQLAGGTDVIQHLVVLLEASHHRCQLRVLLGEVFEPLLVGNHTCIGKQ